MSQQLIPEKLHDFVKALDSFGAPADLAFLQSSLHTLDLNREDFGEVCSFHDEHYQRNIIKRTEFYELVLLCWKPGQCTPIHDHAGSCCAFRVIEGQGKEIKYACDAEGVCRRTQETRLPEGMICASYDTDTHIVANDDPDGMDLITLHIYAPPMKQFHTFEENSDAVALCEVPAVFSGETSHCD